VASACKTRPYRAAVETWLALIRHWISSSSTPCFSRDADQRATDEDAFTIYGSDAPILGDPHCLPT
jgi:hypothetical protein